MAKAGRGESKQGLIISLVFSVIINITLGVLTYMAFADQKKLEDDAKKANDEAKLAKADREWYKFQALGLRAYTGTGLGLGVALTGDEEKDLAVLYGQWKGGQLGKDAKDAGAVQTLFGKFEGDALLGWDPATNKPRNTMLGQAQKLTETQKTDQNRFAQADAATKEMIARLDSQRRNLEKDVADRQKAYEALQAENRKIQADKSKEYIGALTQIEQLQKESDELNKKKADAQADTEKLIKSQDQKIKEQDEKYKHLEQQIPAKDWLALDRPKGKIVSLDRTGGFAYINLGTNDNVKPQLTFSVFAKDISGKAKGERKAAVEVVNVISAHLSMAKITDITDAKADPVLTGDLLFNPSWSASVKEHIAIAGLIDLKGDGSDSSAEFIRDLEKQNIAVDAYLDLKTMTVKGKMSFKTNYLVLGDMPEIDRSLQLSGQDPRTERKTEVINKLSAMQDEATKLGVAVIPARRFMALIGYRMPKTVVPPDYLQKGVKTTEPAEDKKPDENKPDKEDMKKDDKEDKKDAKEKDK